MASDLERLDRQRREALARAEAAESRLAAVNRALDDEEANLADDGARLSHSVVRRVRAAAAGDDR